ncbi:hypothetical protein NKH19_00750 [Mesorhizobium sp. M1338]|uniref:hypothetical protein n=1 Tax=unclassified Mesorhizobium TaxID=325217 RepID=UPI0033391C2F
MAIRAAYLKAMADEGDETGVFAHIVRMLWRSDDPEQRMAARLLLRYCRTGTFPAAAKAKTGRPAGPVKCKRTPTGEPRECEVPRNEIALSVFHRLVPDPKPPKLALAAIFDADERRRSLRRRKLRKAVAETASYFGVSENVVRDCFEEHCDELLLFGDAITWS